MRIIPIILSLFSFLLSNIIHIPEDYATIQEDHDAAVDSDTVLVDQGIYYENLHITKSITLASYALYDDLTNWVAFDDQIFWQWQVENENINNTIIDGSMATDDFGSAILIYQEDNTCITPSIFGFTIQNGLGTQVERDGTQQRLGGGILFDISNPILEYNQFLNNGSGDVTAGDGTYGTSAEEDWSFNNRDLNNRSRCDIDEFKLTNNLYNGNDALFGNTFANRYFEDTFDMSESIFDVANCGIEEVSAVWINIEPAAQLDLNDIASNLCATTASDVYVDSNIGQECIEDGCGTQGNPFKTITWALQMIMPSENNPVTIHLASGTYSPDTGEVFPITLISYVSIEGEDQEATIINALGLGRVLNITDTVENNLTSITITGGYIGPEHLYTDGGAGILIHNSNPILKNLNITNNTCEGYFVQGIGDYSNNGGGIGIYDSTPKLISLNITNNSAVYGGGIMSDNSSFSIFKCNISDNFCSYDSGIADNKGGGISMRGLSDIKIYRSTFENNQQAIEMFSVNSTPSLAITKTLFNDNYWTNNYGLSSAIYSSCWSDNILKIKNVTIADNISLNNAGNPNSEGGGIYSYNGSMDIENSILWDNIPHQIELYTNFDSLFVAYSDIEDGEDGVVILGGGIPDIVWGEGNLATNPSLTNNYGLTIFSPCVNAGNPSPWYNDINGTQNDMGYTGGPNFEINFTEYDFGEVGLQSSSTANWSILNFGDTPIIIDAVDLDTQSFSIINTSFPLVIEPFEIEYIKIQFNPESIGQINDNLSFISSDIADDAMILLTGVGSSTIGNTLSGNLYGTIEFENSPYSIVGDIAVDENDTLIIEPGVEFRFLDQYEFEVNGVLQAIGSETDSIVFNNLDPQAPDSIKWLGIKMYNQSNNTVLRYVKITGATGNVFNGFGYSMQDEGSLSLVNSDPILDHITITENGMSQLGGGLLLEASSPIISNCTISNNVSNYGGGIYLDQSSSPVFNTNIIIENNIAQTCGGGIYIYFVNSILNDENTISILNNTSFGKGGGIYIHASSGLNLSNLYISGNEAYQAGGGLYFLDTFNVNITNSLIHDNLSSSGSAIYYNGANVSGQISFDTVALKLNQVTITENDTDGGGGQESSIYLNCGNLGLINSIFWNNNDPIFLTGDWEYESSLLLSAYSLIENGMDNIVSDSDVHEIIWLDGNIDTNPQFNLGFNDFTLQEDSPCVDAGTAYFEYDEYILDISEDEYFGAAPDMGAYELFIYQSGDINQDLILNILDIVSLVNLVMTSGEYNALADLNGDGIVNVLDIITLVNIILDN